MLVTGGAKGIGRMISEGFVQNGAKVYISSRDAKACEQACKELNALGKGSAYAIPANLYKEEDCKQLAQELGKREKSMYNRLRQLAGWQAASGPSNSLRIYTNEISLIQNSTFSSITAAAIGANHTTPIQTARGPESSH